MDVSDISNEIDCEDVPLCPLCDQPIFSYELVSIGRHDVSDTVCLVHTDCAEDS